MFFILSYFLFMPHWETIIPRLDALETQAPSKKEHTPNVQGSTLHTALAIVDNQDDIENLEIQNQENIPFPDNLFIYPEEYNIITEKGMQMLQEQWNRIHRLSKVPIQNEIRLRQQAWLPELAQDTLIHGISFSEEVIPSIAQKWILASELLWTQEIEDETYYCADFFRVPKDMTVQEYMDFCSQPKTSWDFRFSSPESSRIPIPKKFGSGSSDLGLIVNSHNTEIEDFYQYDYYRERAKENMKEIKFNPPTPIVFEEEEKFDRLSAILWWIPANFIGGIIVGEAVVADESKMQILRDAFPENVVLFDVYGKEIS